jgi:anti-sigma-K factor RskA
MRLTREAKHALAAEYVAGTLRGAARRRFEALARDDRELREVLGRWESLLTPLAENVEPVEPPPRVWRSIEARITPRASVQGETDANAGFWRSLGMLASGLAAVLLVTLLWFSPRAADPSFVAVLTSADSAPRMVVSQAGDQLRVRVVKSWANVEGKSLELWALPKNGAPKSLGLVANERDTDIRLSPSDARLLAANALAVSLEPSGGSRSGAPTGPVLCSGAIAPVRKA